MSHTLKIWRVTAKRLREVKIVRSGIGSSRATRLLQAYYIAPRMECGISQGNGATKMFYESDINMQHTWNYRAVQDTDGFAAGLGNEAFSV